MAIVGAVDFDPQGDGQEHPESAGAVSDGNPGTAWETQTYNNPEFDAPKTGVGIYLELEGAHDLSTVTVTSGDTGWSAEVYVADQPGADLAAWGEPRGSVENAGTAADIPLSPGTRGRYVLLWVTRLPSSGNLNVSEIQVA